MKHVLNSFLFLFSLIPNTIAIALGKVLGKTLHLLGYRKLAITRNMEFVFPDQDPKAKKLLLKKIYRHIGLLIVEIIRQPYFKRLKVKDRITIEGYEEYIVPALKAGNGICFLGAHCGPWEIGGIMLEVAGVNNLGIVKEVKGDLGMHMIKMMRERNDVETVNRRNSIKKVFKQLREGNAVTFVVDQNMTSDEGIFLDFFGKPACTMTALATVARKTKSAVIPAIICRSDDAKSYRVKFEAPIPWIEKESSKEEIEANTQLYNQEVEKMILAQPDQWIWMHKRWKTQPQNKEGQYEKPYH
ncbi:MAG: lysophospholipid acyltransferase family protein [Lentisphaeria bacterium]|nr:lysophospholipid acyltransferase family protein [Lentisphaeria bacterium]